MVAEKVSSPLVSSCKSVIPHGDYVADGLSIVVLDQLFPNMIVGDKANHPWPYLRREVPHNWYCDRRYPEIGFLNRDEVMLLYNLALQFRGKPGLEIGCWMGWSSCHIALAGVQLDVIDPALARKDNEASMRQALAGAGVSNNVRLYQTTSPEAVDQLARARGSGWNFFFIDGNHEAPGPEQDARVCLKYAAADALFAFHDLVCPDVEKGLAVLRDAGFRTMIFETMQIVGVAWRGNVISVDHAPDPSHNWSIPDHLLKYAIAGESQRIRSERIEGLLHLAERELALKDAAIAEITSKLDELGRQVTARAEETARLRDEAGDRERSLASLQIAIAALDRKLSDRNTALHDVTRELADRCKEVSSLKAGVEELRNGINSSQAEVHYLRNRIQGMKRSYSWKLTRPLREVRKFARGLYGQSDNTKASEATSAGEKKNVEALKNKTLRTVLRRYRLLRKSPLVNRSFYKRRYPDAAGARFGRFWHYVTVGAPELRQPNALFDPNWYLAQYPDVASRRLDPLLHYIEFGWKQGYNPNPIFDVKYYLSSNPDVANARIEPLTHFITEGARQGRNPGRWFDTSYYLSRYPEVAASGINPLEHYLSHGAAQRYDPHPLFDTAFYLERKPELSEHDKNPLADYLAVGTSDIYNPEPVEGFGPGRGICVVTPDFVGPVKNGGIGTACYHYAVALAEAGHRVTVLFSGQISRGQANHWRNHYAKRGITLLSIIDLPPVSHFYYGNSWFLETSQRILDFLASQHFDFIHFQDWQANGFWPIRAKRLGYALRDSVLTVMMHSSSKWIDQGMQQFPKDPAVQVRLEYCESYCMQYCDVLLSPSQHMFDWAIANSITLSENRGLIPYLSAHSGLETLTVQPDPSHLIFFGRLETRKGLHIFGDALRWLKVHGDLPQKVSILGKHATVNGVPSEKFLANLASDLPEIEFIIINSLDAFQALDYIRRTRGLVVMPSILDNYPYTVLECIEHGIPFVVAAVGGILEMVDDKVLFSPVASELGKLLASRRQLDHRTLSHKYEGREARERWLRLHEDYNRSSDQVLETRQPKVSVCIPYCNHGRYLKRLVKSFEEQAYPDYEVVVVNHGSAADSTSDFDRLAQRSTDPRFHFTTTANQSPGAARNLAASISTGEYLIFFGPDNLAKDHTFVRRLVEAIEMSNVDCVTVPYDMVDETCMEPSESDILCGYRPLGACIEGGFFENIFGDTTLIVRRRVFDALGGFSTEQDSWEDHEFFLRLCMRSFQLEVYPQSLAYHRVSQQSRSRSSNQYRNLQNLVAQLADASSPTLLNIVKNLALPIVLAQQR